MTITLRATKGSALTQAELDANFTDLNTNKAALAGSATQDFSTKILTPTGLMFGGVDVFTEWLAYTPTVTSASGSFTTVTGAGRYKKVGKTIYFYALVTITTVGTAGTAIDVTLPATAKSANFAFSGRENGVTGALLTAWTSSTTSLRIQKYDGTFIGANGHIMAVSGSYEAA